MRNNRIITNFLDSLFLTNASITYTIGQLRYETIETIESNPVDGKKIEDDVIGTRWKNSHVPMEIMCSVIEEKRREIERIREIDKVKSWEEKVIKKAEERMDFSGRVFIDDPRGLNSSTIADVKNLLQGKSHSELEVLQSHILLHMCSASVNDVEYWQTVLKLIYKYKVKACLKDVNDLRKTDEAEGTGSSCSPEILHREEVGDNFTMKTMGVMEDGDAFSSNNDEVILQSEGLYVHSKFMINPDKVYRMAMRRINTSAGILTVKNFKAGFRGKRCFLIFPIRGSERKGLVSVEVKNKKGQMEQVKK
ncbi:hypothetical protein POM88_030256 [Heracleum sosnowskyi]|uniref:Splicing factor cactin central domain-containing protein n=1 Tax=Heracleum sosnowskyi TaxID=360622 RepID=A0AAD8HW44_9APIA|nr:hypothetical protein POM88_030256 [Heracleum sosnowskyi]